MSVNILLVIWKVGMIFQEINNEESRTNFHSFFHDCDLLEVAVDDLFSHLISYLFTFFQICHCPLRPLVKSATSLP